MSPTALVHSTSERLLPRVVEGEPLELSTISRRPRAEWPSRILLATDGSASTDAAITTVQALARRSAPSVEMIAIYEPRIPLPTSADSRRLAQWEKSDRSDVARVLTAVRRQRARVLSSTREPKEWPLRLAVGHSGSTIVRIADEMSADLVVLGIGPDDPTTRRCTAHCAACAARYLKVPLYAAANAADEPVRCVVALPDGRVHAPTLRAAFGCLASGARVWIALPTAASTAPSVRPSWQSMRDLVVGTYGSDFARHAETIAVECVELRGDPLAAVLRIADDVGAQLIAIPNSGDPGPVRTFLPNLAEPLLLEARCSVLVVPDDFSKAPAANGGGTTAAMSKG